MKKINITAILLLASIIANAPIDCQPCGRNSHIKTVINLKVAI